MIVVEAPAQIVAEVTVAPTVGKPLTVITLVEELVQPVVVFVPTIVYVVVDAGLTVTDAPLNAPGLYVYVFAPVPVIVVEVPAQIVADGETVVPTVGTGFTVTVTALEFVQPLAPVPVTVYVFVDPGKKETPFVIPPVHEYDTAPVPLSVTGVPEHTVEDGVAVNETVGARLGFVVIARVADVPAPHELTGATVMFPEVVPKTILMLVEFCPEEIVVPLGTVHVYEVAPETGLIEYVAVAPLHKEAGPAIDPAAEGV